MAEKRFKVRVFTKAVDPRTPSEEDKGLAFNFFASNVDRAGAKARAQLEARGMKVLSLSHAPEQGIVVTIAREAKRDRAQRSAQKGGV